MARNDSVTFIGFLAHLDPRYQTRHANSTAQAALALGA